MDDLQFNRLIERARAGDDAAIEELLMAFESDVRLIVRTRLPRLLRGQFDSMDFVQAVWKSVLADRRCGGKAFDNAAHFRGFLAGVAHNKVLQEFRRHTKTESHDLAREEPLYVRHGDREEPREVASPDPSASELFQADDLLGRIAAGRTPHLAEILELRRQGMTQEEIARHLRISDRSVRRALDEAYGRLEREEGRRWPS